MQFDPHPHTHTHTHTHIHTHTHNQAQKSTKDDEVWYLKQVLNISSFVFFSWFTISFINSSRVFLLGFLCSGSGLGSSLSSGSGFYFGSTSGSSCSCSCGSSSGFRLGNLFRFILKIVRF